MTGSKPKQLAKKRLTFFTYASSCFKHGGTEKVICVSETRIVLCVFLQPIDVCKEMLRLENVIATSTARPFEFRQQGMVTSPGRRPVVGPKIPFFSSTGERRPSSANRWTPVTKAIVSDNDVRVLSTASGMVTVTACRKSKIHHERATARPRR